MEHRMVKESESQREILLVCDTCDRKVVVGFKPSRLVVIEQGDFSIQHSIGLNGVGEVTVN